MDKDLALLSTLWGDSFPEWRQLQHLEELAEFKDIRSRWSHELAGCVSYGETCHIH
jgi:hypothetical protein